jgi:hypothetical protein
LALPGIIYLFFVWLPFALTLMIIYFVFRFLTCPLLLIFPSANVEIDHKDADAIQKYLDYFELVNAKLVACLTDAHSRVAKDNSVPPRPIRFWPTKKNTNAEQGKAKMGDYSFSQSCGLFWRLEAAGWKRKLLLTFLRERVEESVTVPEAEKEAFSKAMKNVLRGEFVMPVWRLTDINGGYIPYFLMAVVIRRPTKWETKEGRVLVEVSLDSVDWVLSDGALLQSKDLRTWNALNNLRSLPLWEVVTTAEDMEKGIGSYKWQFLERQW